MSLTHSIGIFVVVALCTVFTRVIPFALFGGNREMPKVIKYLGDVLPPAIMAVLVIYCLKNVDFLSKNHGLAEMIAAALVVALHVWKKNVLLSIGAGTLCYMLLINTFFPFS